VRDESVASEVAAESGPELVRLEHVQEQPASVLGLIAVPDRMRRFRALEDGHLLIGEPRHHDVGREDPHRRAEQRDVDHGRHAGALAAEERRRDATGHRHATRRVAEGGALHDRRGGARRREGMRDAAARPERRRVVATLLGIGAGRALAMPAHVDDPQVDGPDGLHVDAELAACLGQEVGEEDVGGLDEPDQHVAPLRVADVDADAALPAVRLLHHEVDAAGVGEEAGGHQAPLRVAGDGMLDFDDVGAPVGQHRPGRRHEPPLRDLDDAHPREDLLHVGSLACPPSERPAPAPHVTGSMLGQPAMATPPRPLGRPARFFFMHLGTLVSIIVYFVLLPRGLARALWTALAVHTAYMLLAHWQGERKQFDVGLWLYLAVGALATAAGVAPLIALYQRYSPALLFTMFGLVAVIPLVLGREPFTVWFGVR